LTFAQQRRKIRTTEEKVETDAVAVNREIEKGISIGVPEQDKEPSDEEHSRGLWANLLLWAKDLRRKVTKMLEGDDVPVEERNSKKRSRKIILVLTVLTVVAAGLGVGLGLGLSGGSSSSGDDSSTMASATYDLTFGDSTIAPSEQESLVDGICSEFLEADSTVTDCTTTMAASSRRRRALLQLDYASSDFRVTTTLTFPEAVTPLVLDSMFDENDIVRRAALALDLPEPQVSGFEWSAVDPEEVNETTEPSKVEIWIVETTEDLLEWGQVWYPWRQVSPRTQTVIST